MATITQSRITIHGSTKDDVAKLLVNGTEVTVYANKTFSYTIAAPAHNAEVQLIFTAVNTQGVSETRSVLVSTADRVAVLPSANG
jgi:hypothetical protein